MSLLRRLEPALFYLGLALWLALLILGVLQQTNPLQVFPSLDSGYYLYTGQQILQGKIPYQDLWESKPPGIFYANALALWLGRGTRWGVWLLECAVLAASAWLCWQVLRRQYGIAPALMGSLAWLWGLQGVIDGGNLTEEYSLLFSFLALWAFLNALQTPTRLTWPFLVGLCFAASFLFRANNTGIQVAMVLAWVVSGLLEGDFPLLLRRLAASGLAVILLLGLVSVFLARQGILGQAIEAALLFNFALTGGPRDILGAFATGVSYLGIPAGFAALGFLLLVVSPSRFRNPWNLLLAFCFPIEIWLSSLSGRGYHHYFIPWVPTLALLSAWLFSHLTDLNVLLERRRAWAILVLVVLTALFLRPIWPEYEQSARRILFEREKGIELDHPVAAYLRKNTEPNDAVLVWGARLAFNYLSRRENPSSVLFYPLLVASPISDKLAQRFLTDVTTRPPALIVDTSAVNQDLLPSLNPSIRREQEKSGQLWPSLPKNVRDFYAFVESYYHQETSLNDYTLYRINQP